MTPWNISVYFVKVIASYLFHECLGAIEVYVFNQAYVEGDILVDNLIAFTLHHWSIKLSD